MAELRIVESANVTLRTVNAFVNAQRTVIAAEVRDVACAMANAGSLVFE